MIRLATIGTSSITENLLMALAQVDGVEFVGTLSRDAERAAAFTAKHRGTCPFTSLDELAASDEVDAVYIGSPNALHHHQALACIAGGKHVLVEKPFCANVSAPVIGVTLALEEDRANGAQVEDAAIQGVKVGMMGPLAGVGDPVFWFTLRPILGALGASLALGGSIMGPLLFFFAWNIIRIAFLWYTQEFGYKVGTSITKDLSGGLMGKITEGASILGMFIIGALVQRWVSISFTPVVSTVQQSPGAYIDWASLPAGAEGIHQALSQYAALGPTGLEVAKVTTLQANLDQLIPGLAAVGLTLLCCQLLKKKVSPIVIIIALFAVGIIARLAGIM